MRKAEVQMPPQKGREHGLNVAPPSPGIPSKRAKVSGDQTEPDSVDPVHPQPTPPVFIRRMRNAAVGTGCDIRLKVAVAGDPQPTLQWYHNDLLLESESQEYGGLWIRDCKPSDAGLYTCVATNSLGEARSSAVLAVLDLGEDSENTEDEAAEVHMEAKEGLRGPRKQAALGLPTGEGEGPPDRTSDLSSETDRWGPRQEMIIEKEVQTLGSRAPGLQDPLKPSRSKSEDVQKLPSPKVSLPIKSSAPSHIGQAPTDSHASCKKAPLPTSYVDTVPGDLEENLKQPKPSSVSQCSSQGYSPHTPLSEYSRKEALSRPRVFESSKVFEKVRLFEDGRRSEDNNEGSISGRSWAGFNRASSIDSDDGGSRWGISRESSKEDLQGALKADAAKKRSMFRQKVASLEDKSHYSQKVQDIENKFTEELQRIKKIVGKSHMRKSFSTEQLSQRSRQPLRKLEPIPPQVLQKLEDRERIQKLQELELKKPAKQQGPQISSILLKDPPFYGDTPAKHPQEETNREEPATLGAMPIAELPGQPLQGKTIRSNKMTYAPQKSSPPEASLKTRHQTSNTHPQKETSPPKMLEQRAEHQTTSPPLQNRLSLMQGESAKAPPGLNKLQDFSSSVPTDVREEEKMEVEATTPLSDVRFHIPTIIIEENPMEKDIPPASEKQKRDQYVKEGRTQRSRGKIHRTRPMSPELDSSDDSYMSAGEDTHEAPMFEYPLQDTVASSGSEVLLKCIIGGNPLPEVTWKKDGTEIANSLAHMIKVEGERHSLLIICANPSDAGTYHITAVNDAGRTSCSATLFIRSELTKEQQNLGVPSDINSPITSDEEYLSPLEEVMDSGTSTCQGREHLRMLDTRFKEPPTFQVSLSDQLVGIEGKEVVMSVQVKGQPKPMIYWLRDRVTIKIDTRHLVHETDEGCFEMKIISAQKSDTGMYTCKIINEYGTKQCECFLEVRAPPLEPVLAVLQRVNDVTVKAGESALFECHMTGPSDVDVDWLSNGKLIQPALLDCKMLFDGKTCRLLLSSVHEDDSGTYTCKLSTAREELTSSAFLKVIPSTEPLFARKLVPQEVIEGRTARFDCKVSGLPPPTVTWSHFDHPLSDSECIRIVQEGGRHSLLIYHVDSDSEGLYVAMARNVHGAAESSAELYVQEPRPAVSSQMAKLEKMPSIPEEPEVLENEMERFRMPDFIKPLYDLDVVEGKEAVLRCQVSGLPYPTITWFHNGRLISSTEDRKMTQFKDMHSLVIRSVCHGHGGVYKSVISNKVGKAACYAHLYVTDILPDPPDGPPIITSVTGRSISLQWKKPRKLDPSIDANSVMYAVQQQALGSTQWNVIATGLKQTAYTVNSLSKGLLYSFRVLSTTNKAFSKPSPSTEHVQLVDRGPYLHESPVIIDKPDIVYLVENKPAAITITLNHVQANVTWKRNEVVLRNHSGVYETSMPDDDQHALCIVHAKSSDVGLLTCGASNQLGSDLCSVTLEMATPPTFESIMEDLEVCVGDTPRFAVVVEGKPVPDILWFKNDTQLSESSHITFVYDDNECSLVVLNTRLEDSGVYTCTAKNLAGSVSCKAELSVQEACTEKEEPMEDEETILRKMRRLTDYYDVHKEIGRGAFSYVKQVTQKSGNVQFAAKFISAHAKKKVLALRELRLLSHLQHERIVNFHDAFEKRNVVVIITELCHEEFLERVTKKSTVMEADIRSIVRQLLEGVAFLHQKNILHLDIKPENILMANMTNEQIRICDFGNAIEIIPGEAQYCKYGTPEFVAPEIVNLTPVSMATDIWPIGVITYLCLTGVSPFAGENDRSTVLNIRNSNVAFEEAMFAELCREARGFVIKLLVADRLRPDASECLRHPWFKTVIKAKTIPTEALKQFLSRRKWQRSLISYKSKMVMRSIPELLDDSSNHISIAVLRNLKEGSPPPSSSSDSDEDVDELPFIPMPLGMEFSGSRMSLNEIPFEDEIIARSNSTVERSGPISAGVVQMEYDSTEQEMEGGTSIGRRRNRMWESQEDKLGDEMEVSEPAKRLLQKGLSMESENAKGSQRRGELRRGSSADSALLLHITTKENVGEEDETKALKKAVSMEIPRRSTSPAASKLSQQDYALKLELMRQRLLRGGSVDNKMSGLRGPLLETLGMGDEKHTSSLDRYQRSQRLGAPPLIRAASSDTPGHDSQKDKILRKSASFSQGDTEPIPLHRRSGAPLEIPLAQVGECRLQEAPSMSNLMDQTTVVSRPVTPRDVSSKPSTSAIAGSENELKIVQDMKKVQESESKLEDLRLMDVLQAGRVDEEFKEPLSEKSTTAAEPQGATEVVVQRKLLSEVAPMILDNTINDKGKNGELLEVKAKRNLSEVTTSSSSITPPTPNTISQLPGTSQSHLAQPMPNKVTLPDGRKSAYASIMQTIIVPSLQPSNIEAPASISLDTLKPGSSPGPLPSISTMPIITSSGTEKTQSTEHPAVFSKVAYVEKAPTSPVPEQISLRPSPPREPILNHNIKDIASEQVFEARFKKRDSSLTRSLKLLTKGKPDDKPTATAPLVFNEEVYRPGAAGAPLVFDKAQTPRLVERCKSFQDLRDTEKDIGFMRRLSLRLRKNISVDRKDEGPANELAVTSEPAAPRRRLSWAVGSRSQDKKEAEMVKSEVWSGEAQVRPGKPNESPVLAMRRKIESKVAGISMRFRSQSEERKDEGKAEERESKPENKRTPLLSMLRRSISEGVNLQKMDMPQNKLDIQTAPRASMESLESTSSVQTETFENQEGEQRSRWGRWGLSRSKKEKASSQMDIPSSIARGNGTVRRDQYSRLASDFPPVFHIKLRDHILLEGDPVTLSCLPASSPPPHIIWMKDKKPLEVDPRTNIISCPDGRQLIMIMKTTKKDAGLYECVATNPLASVSSSCTISLARLPNRPGTPEIPQTYKDTALVLWKPSETMGPCTYSLERKNEGESNWLIVATGVADCYYNVTDLPQRETLRFRVACVNKAGQGPYSSCSEKVCLTSTAAAKVPATVVVKTLSSSPSSSSSSAGTDPIPLPPKSVSPATVSSLATFQVQIPAPPPTEVAPMITSATKAIAQARPSTSAPSPSVAQTIPIQTAPLQSKAKTTVNMTVISPLPAIPTSTTLPLARPGPPIVLPKLQSPINVVSPMTQSPPTSPPPLVSPPPTINKPIASIPMYISVNPTPTTTIPVPAASPVVLVSSVTPVGGVPSRTAMYPDHKTHSGKPGESTLRQGVPQKPYTFLDEKNRGRFGVIRECRENATGLLFMAKIVPYEADSKQRVLQEYDILKSLHHKNIMALHEAYVTPRYLVLICEYCTGKELLYSLVDRFRYSEDDVVGYIVQILQGLEYLHNRHILHLDIKPDNIIVARVNMVKIIDFGSSQTFNPLFLKQCSPHVGTMPFMSPEMVKGEVVGPPADIWSLGILTYVMLSGRLPFQEATEQETESRILAAKFEQNKLYPNVSQSASLFLKKIMCSYPWARPTIKDCFSNAWLQDAYLMKLRRQTLTFTTSQLKEFLVQQERRRAESVTKHKVLLRSYQSSPATPAVPTTSATQ